MLSYLTPKLVAGWLAPSYLRFGSFRYDRREVLFAKLSLSVAGCNLEPLFFGFPAIRHAYYAAVLPAQCCRISTFQLTVSQPLSG
jgi:hypothetical protein